MEEQVGSGLKEKQNKTTTRCPYTVLFTHDHATRRCLATSTALNRPPGALSLRNPSAIASASDGFSGEGRRLYQPLRGRGSRPCPRTWCSECPGPRELSLHHRSSQHAFPCLTQQGNLPLGVVVDLFSQDAHFRLAVHLPFPQLALRSAYWIQRLAYSLHSHPWCRPPLAALPAVFLPT